MDLIIERVWIKNNVNIGILQSMDLKVIFMIYNLPDSVWKIDLTPLMWTLIHKQNGRLRLVPDRFRFSEIEKDYKAMAEMIYVEYPNFEEIIKVLQELEKEINK